MSSFVKSYNDVRKTLQDVTAYDASGAKAGGTTGRASPLQGDATIRSIEYRMRQLFTTRITG